MKFQIKRGKQASPIRLTAYGPEGIGKSTFASNFPDPVFLDLEGGTKQLDVRRLDPGEEWTWSLLLEAVDAVIEDPSMCKTLVIDTADKAEALLTQTLLDEGGVDSIEKYGGGYGKGYTALAERFAKDLLKRLDKVIACGINVTILAHAWMRKFESPEEAPYDRWELKVSKKVAPLIKEWTDILVFMNYEVKVIEENGRQKAKGTAKRTMVFNHRPTCDAKNRYGLEDNLPLSFEPLRAIYEGVTQPQPEKIMLNVDAPNEGVVEDTTAEDPRDVVVRRLKAQGITKKRFEEWLKATGRPDVKGLSTTQALSMAENIDTLIDQIKGGKEE